MKQVLLRVPDDVHRRLAERAAAEHRSVNALATELLDEAVDASPGTSERLRLMARARRLGLLEQRDVPAETPMSAAVARAEAARVSRGIGPRLDDLLVDGR